jgi:hypothetical protein
MNFESYPIERDHAACGLGEFEKFMSGSHDAGIHYRTVLQQGNILRLKKLSNKLALTCACLNKGISSSKFSWSSKR